jgi:hypothetical protein
MFCSFEDCSIRQSGRTPTLRAAHEDVTNPPSRCVGGLHTTHFADARRDWRQVRNARFNRCAEIAGTDMGIKRLCQSGERDDGGEDHGCRKVAHGIFSFDTARARLHDAVPLRKLTNSRRLIRSPRRCGRVVRAAPQSRSAECEPPQGRYPSTARSSERSARLVFP